MPPRSTRPPADADSSTGIDPDLDDAAESVAEAVPADVPADVAPASAETDAPPPALPASRPPAVTPESDPSAFAWVRYVGSHTGGVLVPGDVFVEHGAAVQVPVELAADLCARVEYGEPQWLPAEAPAPSDPEES